MHDRTATLCGRQLDGSAHVCAFFSSRDEMYSTLVPFFREGVEQKERILNVVEDDGLDDHVARLRSHGLPAVAPPHSDHFEVRPASDAYFPGGRFDPLEIVTMVRGKLDESRAEGIGTRTYGDMSWVTRPDVDAERVIEYEARVNFLTPVYRCTLVCGYDLARISGGLLADIIATHPFVILKGQIRENPWYMDPGTYLAEILQGSQRKSKSSGSSGARPEGLEPPTP